MRARRILLFACTSWLAFTAGVASADVGARVVSEAESGKSLVVTFEPPAPLRREIQVDDARCTAFEFPGLAIEGEPGTPETPVGRQWIAVPPGGTARFAVLETDIEDLGTFLLAPRADDFLEADADGREMPRNERRYDPARYRTAGREHAWVTLGEPGMLRHVEAVPVDIRPLRYDVATGRTQRLRRIVVRFDLRAGAVAPDDAARATAARFATSASWERIYAGALLNPRSAMSWRRAPARVVATAKPLASGLLRPGLLGEDEWKIRTVTATGPARILATTAIAAGFPDGLPIARLRLVLKRFNAASPLVPDVIEIPIAVEDADGDMNFRAGDSFVFYAEHPRDDATSEDTLARSSGQNVYWLSEATSGTPARMPIRPRRTDTVAGPATFIQRTTLEEDLLMNVFVYGNNDDMGDTEQAYFWTGIARTTRIRVPVPARAPGAALTAAVITQQDYLRRAYEVYLRTGSRDSVFLGSDFGTPPMEFDPPPVVTVGNTVADAQLDPGDATIILRPFDLMTGFVPFVNAIRLEYAATYTATANRVRCTSGGAVGPVAIAIGGFTDSGLRAFDVTDPKRPAVFDLAGAYSSGTLTLHDNVATGSEHAYVVVPSATIPSLAVELDRRDDILQELASAPAGTYDCLVVTHDSFADNPDLARWIAFRTSQRHRIRVVRTSDIYDAFRGGLLHYEAIHRMSQMAFQNWGIESLLLVGDGSEDARGILRDSGPNLVPARVRYFRVASSSGGDNVHRNDINDKWYAQMSPLFTDPPDLLIGRWPVADADELRAVVDKTLLYEQPASGDDGRWRKRVVMLSDDEWIKRTVPDLPGIQHRRGCSEVDFERSIVRASDIVDAAFPGDLHAVRFLLREHSNKLCNAIAQHCGVSFDSCFVQAPHPSTGTEVAHYQGQMTDGTVGKSMIDSVGAGALFLALQSHASRAVVADEFIMSTLEPPFAPVFRNDGKPFVFFGFGCHLNEYGVPSENGAGVGAGDALGERMVMVPSRGAVASYASTGFEYLQPNNAYHELMWSILFNKDYVRLVGGGSVDSDTLAARWRLAEILEITEITWPDPQGRGGAVKARHNLLGDPLLQLDAGVPRVTVDQVTNGMLQANNRFFVNDRNQPLGLKLTFADEQGIDSLWAVKRFRGGAVVPIDSIIITSSQVDTLRQVREKRKFTVELEVLVEGCDFDIVVGARDLAGRVTEFVGGVIFDHHLLANGVEIQTGAVVDPRTAFRFEIGGCAPILPPLQLEVYLDGALRTDVVTSSDTAHVNWTAEFTADLSPGAHTLRFVYEGSDLAVYTVTMGTFSLTEVLVFPNPMRKQHRVTRVYFHLGAPVAGGGFRILDLNGRTVLKRDLRTPGVVKSDVEVPPGGIGSGTGQDDTHWNYIEWDGRDVTGDEVANGVYLLELSVQDHDGQSQRHRDKIVLMR